MENKQSVTASLRTQSGISSNNSVQGVVYHLLGFLNSPYKEEIDFDTEINSFSSFYVFIHARVLIQ